MIVTLDDGGREPRVTPTAGCSLGRQRVDRETGIFSAELVIDRTLARDETWVYELCLDQPEPSEDVHVDHYATREVRTLLVWVRFSPSRLPARVERYTVVDAVERVEEMVLGDGSGAHALARAFGPGILGVRWTW